MWVPAGGHGPAQPGAAEVVGGLDGARGRPCPRPGPPRSGGSPATTQWTKPSASTSRTTRPARPSRPVPPVHSSGGDTSSARHVYRAGISPSSAMAELDSVRGWTTAARRSVVDAASSSPRSPSPASTPAVAPLAATVVVVCSGCGVASDRPSAESPHAGHAQRASVNVTPRQPSPTARAGLDAAVDSRIGVSRHGARVLQTVATSDERAVRPALPPGLSMRPHLADVARLRALLGPDAAGARQSLVALGLNSSTSLVAGRVPRRRSPPRWRSTRACSCSSRPPSACGATSSARSATGSRRRSTPARSAGRCGARPCSARTCSPSMLLTMGISLALAVVAKAVAVGLGLTESIDVLDLATVSIVGGAARLGRGAGRHARADGRARSASAGTSTT